MGHDRMFNGSRGNVDEGDFRDAHGKQSAQTSKDMTALVPYTVHITIPT